MPCRVGDGHRPRVAVPQQGEALRTAPVYDRLQIEEVGLQRKITHLAVGQPATSPVVPDDHPLLRQALIPPTILGPLPLHLDVTHGYRRHVHEGRALTHRPAGDAHPVRGLGVLDAWLHYSSSRQRTSNSRTGSSNPLSEEIPRSANRKSLPATRWRTP